MMRLSMLMGVLLALAAIALPARAQTPSPDETAVRALIQEWYAEQRAGEDGRPWRLMAPGGIDASPGYRYADTGSAALGRRIYTSLAATALDFNYEIDRLKIDGGFARANVWERGYSYAFAVQRTYESAASALFVLERQEDGRWLVLAHQSGSAGIPPNRITDPMPDLRELFYSTTGKTRDPEADARAAENGF